MPEKKQETAATEPVSPPEEQPDPEKEKALRKAAKAQAVLKAAKDLRDAWVASAFYDRQDPALAEALIDALENS